MIEYLKNKIKSCDELGGMEKEKWAFTQCLKHYRENSNQVQVGVKPACEQCNKFEECEIRKLVWFDMPYPKPLCKFFCSEFESKSV